MLRVGLVGCGKIAEKHLAAYRGLGCIDVTVTDIVPKGKTVAEQYGASWCDDPEKLIKTEAVDVIDVCIPTPSHAEVMLRALDNGKHVFCEKPFTRTVEEAERVAQKAVEVGKSVMIGYPYRFHPGMELVKEVLSQEVVGKPHLALLRIGGRGDHKAWKHLRHTGGGAVSEMMVHMLDLILWYFGDIVEAEALSTGILLKERTIEGKPISPDAEDFVLVQLKSEEAVTVLCESDLVTPSYMNMIEIHGSNGSVVTSVVDHFPTLVYCKEPKGGYKQGNNVLTFPRVDFFQKELDYFIKNVQNGQHPVLNTVDDSLRIMRLINRLQLHPDVEAVL